MSWGGPKRKGDEGPGLTKETQALLADVMKQRGLSYRAQQDVAQSLKSGSNAWVDRLSTGTAAARVPQSQAAPLVNAPKVGQAALALPSGQPPARFSGKKMLDEIQRDTPAEREQFRGGAPAPDREAEKERLAKVMELGRRGFKDMQQRTAAMKEAALQRSHSQRPLDVREELIDQIVGEIRDRCEFLEDMRGKGMGKQYEAQVQGEVAQRLKELDRLGLRNQPPPQVQAAMQRGKALPG